MARTVHDMMTPEPVTVDAQMSIKAAAHMMRTWDVREVLVVENGALRGLLTDRDVVVIAIAAGRHPAEIRAGECCDTEVPTVRVDEPADRAAEVMEAYGRKRLPVVDRDRRLLGTVWATDLELARSDR